MNYLELINQCTPTRWWHDSGNPDEIELALKRGATGVTTNPVLTFRSFQSQPDFWNPKVLALGDDFPTLEAHAEALLKLVATYAADKVRPFVKVEISGRPNLLPARQSRALPFPGRCAALFVT